MRMLPYKMAAFFVFFLIGTISLSVQTTCAAMIGCSNDEAPSLFQINTANGSSTVIGALPESTTECVYDPINQKLFAQASDGSFTLYTIDPATGASLGSVATEAAFNGMAFVGNTLYATAITHGGGNSDLVTVNPVTGALTTIGATGFGPIPGLAYNAAKQGVGVSGDKVPSQKTDEHLAPLRRSFKAGYFLESAFLESAIIRWLQMKIVNLGERIMTKAKFE